MFTSKWLKAAATDFQKLCPAWNARIMPLRSAKVVVIEVTPTTYALFGLADGQWARSYMEHDGTGVFRSGTGLVNLHRQASDIRGLLWITAQVEVDRNLVSLGLPPRFDAEAYAPRVRPSSRAGLHAIEVLHEIA